MQENLNQLNPSLIPDSNNSNHSQQIPVSSSSIPQHQGSQNINQFQYAGLYVRFIATYLDTFILYLPVFVLVFIPVVLLTKSDNVREVADISQIIAGLIIVLLDIFFVAKFGATPGKMVAGIRVVQENGKVPDFKTALKREFLGKIVSSLILNLGYLWIAFDKEKQGIHDKIAKTHVIYIRPLSGVRKLLFYLFPLSIPFVILIAIIFTSIS